MPNLISHKQSSVAGVVPTAEQLAVGEIAINTADGKIYTRTAAGEIVELTEATVADGGEIGAGVFYIGTQNNLALVATVNGTVLGLTAN